MNTIFKFLHSIMVTLTLQISKLTKAVVLNFFPHGRFWQLSYKENCRCTRLMRRSVQVAIRQTFVIWMLFSLAQPPRLMPKEFQLLVYILHFLGVEMTDWMNLLCWYMFVIHAMRSCSEHTILHCVESYLCYIILANEKKYFLSSEMREKINRQFTYIVENIKFIYTSFDEFFLPISQRMEMNYIFSDNIPILYLSWYVKSPKELSNCLKRAETSVVLIVFECVLLKSALISL